MHKTIVIAAGCAFLAAAAAFAADPSVGQIYDGQLKAVEGEFVPLAEAMPESKYSFTPNSGEFKGVRSFAMQVKHVAAVLYMVSAAAKMEKPPVDLGSGENGPDSVKTKAEIVQFLKDAFAYSHKAMLSITAENQLEMAAFPFGPGKQPRGAIAAIAPWHCMDHYGQMVVYARMNGVIPPASAGQR
jgi:hypothetical protein